eukprot:Clim_evm2s91 gene=Clim_evmTU2s91
MNFKLAVLSAAMAVASAGSSGHHTSPVIPQFVRNFIVNDPNRFTSETARQHFLAGETDDVKATQIYLGTQTTFGKGDCTEAATVTFPSIVCGVFTLEGDFNEVVVHKDTRLGGVFTVGKTQQELKYQAGDGGYEYHWRFPDTTFQLDGVQSWTIEIGEEGKEPIVIEKDWNESLFAVQIDKGPWWDEMRPFWYRFDGHQPLPGSDRYLWCGMFAEPKC